MSEKFNGKKLVYTVRNLCKVCYTCVRECPVKAIRIINGQAEVMPERCIACGNCVMVCSQGAKVYSRSVDTVKKILQSDFKTVACLAPSFPAEFSELDDPVKVVSMIRRLGFDHVTEVSFGADLVAREYRKIFDDRNEGTVITSDCPAIVKYIEKYHPDLVRYLAPIDSPAMATARVVRKKYGNDVNPVFIGPCIAKKSESELFSAVLTFSELREMFAEKNIIPTETVTDNFDPPFAGSGSIFPMNHGLIKSINRSERFGKGEVIIAEGKPEFIEAVYNFENGILSGQHLELQCCDGCLQGPGMTRRGDRFLKRKKVNEYADRKIAALDRKTWEVDADTFSPLKNDRVFTPSDQRLISPDETGIREVLGSMDRNGSSDILNCGACGYESCFEFAIAVTKGLAETEMCLPWAINKLHETVDDLNEMNRNLALTKQALKQSEKLASMGQVSAGIAHELNNPLGIISLYSSILKEEISSDDPLYKDISIIDEQAERCRKIVGGLLNFARRNHVRLESCNIIEFVNESFRSVIIPENVALTFDHSVDDPLIRIDRDQMMQVLSNLYRNAYEAMPGGGRLSVRLEQSNGDMIILITDTGTGIQKENIEKIFTPFFTTKEPGKGTGLGLPLVYGIIKMHKGKITVNSNCDPDAGPTGTTFRINIPGSL